MSTRRKPTPRAAGIDRRTAEAIGEIKGLLSGIKDMIGTNHAAVNSRIDDLRAAVHQRMDSADERIAKVEATAAAALDAANQANGAMDVLKRSALKSGGASGAGAGTLMAVGFEFIKSLIS